MGSLGFADSSAGGKAGSAAAAGLPFVMVNPPPVEVKQQSEEAMSLAVAAVESATAVTAIVVGSCSCRDSYLPSTSVDPRVP